MRSRGRPPKYTKLTMETAIKMLREGMMRADVSRLLHAPESTIRRWEQKAASALSGDTGSRPQTNADVTSEQVA